MNKFYVYTLTNPITGNVFYVGKGCGNRAYQHERNVIRNQNKYSKLPKDKEILSIISAGKSVIVSFVKKDMLEEDALLLEAETIKSIGITNLSNVMQSGAISGSRFSEAVNFFKTLGAAYLTLPEAWRDHEFNSCDGVSLQTIHDELRESEIVAMGIYNNSDAVKGYSMAIESHKGRLFSLIKKPDAVD